MINIGNKKVKKLYKGDDLVTKVHKGDELIYVDLEAIYAYKMTIDTRLKDDGTSDPTDNAMILGLGETGLSGVNIGKNLKVYWGDGTDTVVDTSSRQSQTLKHEYPTPGVYQLSIVPTKFVGGLPVKSWLKPVWGSNYAANDIITGVSQSATLYKVKSIDNKIPERGLCIGEEYASSPADTLQYQFAYLSNIESVPEGWLENVEINNTRNSAYMLFYRFARHGKLANVNDVLVEISNFFNRAKIESCGTGFYAAFNGFNEIVIPDDFVVFTEPSYIPIASMANNMFGDAFANCNKVTIGERMMTFNFPTKTNIYSNGAQSVFNSAFTNMEEFNAPECLIKVNAPVATSIGQVLGNGACNYAFTMKNGYTTSIDITDKFIDIQAPMLTDFRYRFSYNLMSSSNRVAINFKTGAFKVTTSFSSAENMFRELFSDMNSGGRFSTWEPGAIEINTSGCTNTSYMFHRLLGSAPISPGVIIPMNTDNVVNFSYMFYGYDISQNNATIIWQDLLSSTANGVNFNSMFYRTYYGRQDFIGTTLSSSFFDLDTSNGTDFRYMFYRCFSQVAAEFATGFFSNIDTTNGQNFDYIFSEFNVRYNSSQQVPLNDVFDSMTSYNWATQTNVDNGYIVDRMFGWSDTGNYLTGAAQPVLQHFGFTPTRRTRMFQGQTSLTDYNTINANWK